MFTGMNTPATAAAIYTRISQDQTGQRAGVTRQLEDCQALADRCGFTVEAHHHFDDNDISAYSGKRRKGYEAMLAALQRGEFTAILCWHPDRLYRSLKDLERLIDIADATGAQIKSVNGGDFDLSNATGKMIARILGSVSRQESEHKAERQRRANAQRRAAGRYPMMHIPFGYERTGDTITPTEPQASMIRAAAASVLAGVSLNSICKDWNARGFTTTYGNRWYNGGLRRVLTNPTYAACTVIPRAAGARNRIAGDGDWEPILDRETHDALVAVLSDPARFKHNRFERTYIGSGVYVCGLCGNRLRGKWLKRDGKAAYVCAPDLKPGDHRSSGPMHLSRLVAPLDAYVDNQVLELLTDYPNIRARLLASRPDAVDLGPMHTRRAALVERRKELIRLLGKGLLPGPEVEAEAEGLVEQIAAIDATLAEAAASSAAMALLNGDASVPLLTRWANCTPDMKGKIIDELMIVTVQKAPRGQKKFLSNCVDIDVKI